MKNALPKEQKNLAQNELAESNKINKLLFFLSYGYKSLKYIYIKRVLL